MSSSIAEAVRLLQAGRLAEAEAMARALVAARRDAGALHILGCIRAQSGARDEALGLLDEAIALDPRDASFLNNRARVLAELGRLAEAERDLRLALTLYPGFAAAQKHLSTLLARRGVADMEASRFAEAEQAFRAVVAANPASAEALNNLGAALQHLGRLPEAVDAFRRALQIDPGMAGAYVNLANATENMGDLESARTHYLRALELAPTLADAWVSAASNALELGLRDEARTRYQRALELRPGWPEAAYGLGMLDLREHRFAEGWRGLELRFDTRRPQATRRAPPLPSFLPRKGPRDRVAVWTEQGVGDQILYSTLLPELIGDADAVVEVDPRLVAAYARSVKGATFVTPQTSHDAFASCRSQVAIGSLPLLYRPDRESFSSQPARLLHADPARVAEYRARLGDGRFIAIAWRSMQRGMRVGMAARKSIPLDLFARLAGSRGARLVDVQYGDAQAERAAFDAAHPGVRVEIPGLDAFNDLEGVLAAIEACGEVVTASNVTAHLGGAAGVRATVVVLGARAFHYWHAVDGTRSLWYPSLRVANDPAWKSWDDAFAAIERGE